ncbi:MAG: PDZ domain-containing protein [Polyangiaceae bacterium]
MRGASLLRPVRALAALFVVGVAAGCGGTTGSIGAVLGRDDETLALHVREAPAGMAAARAGLAPGDQIVMIDGFYVENLTTKQVQTLLRGDPGTTVELTVLRGEAVRRVRVVRAPLREKKKKDRPEQSSGSIE